MNWKLQSCETVAWGSKIAWPAFEKRPSLKLVVWDNVYSWGREIISNAQYIDWPLCTLAIVTTNFLVSSIATMVLQVAEKSALRDSVALKHGQGMYPQILVMSWNCFRVMLRLTGNILWNVWTDKLIEWNTQTIWLGTSTPHNSLTRQPPHKGTPPTPQCLYHTLTNPIRVTLHPNERV